MGALPFALPDITEQEVEAVSDCLRSGWLTSGRKVQEFEARFAEFVGAKHAIAVNSATAGALLTLDALGVGPGDEVIVPAMTFSGPAMMAHKLGATVVFADCLPGEYQVDPASVAAKITDSTKVVMPTHFGGAACHTAQLKELCDEREVFLIDDAAHAFPTRYANGQLVGAGNASDATFFSFYATKCLTTGEGGMVTTDDDVLATEIRQIRLHGFDRAMFDRYTNVKTGWRYDVAYPGWKANMTDIAAAMGIVQLDRAAEMRTRRAEIAQRYLDAFHGVGGIVLPEADQGHAWHLFTLRLMGRDLFVEEMAKRGVQCSVHFIPLHLHSYWQEVSATQPGDLPHAEAVFEETVSLPIFSSMTDAMVQTVIDAVVATLETRHARRA